MLVKLVAGAANSGNSGVSDLLGGANLLQLLVLAFGGALVIGNGLALVRPPADNRGRRGAPDRRVVTRCLVMMGVGLIAAIWAIATLAS
jgi:hypothetical protein